MKIGYARVSSSGQSLELQVEQLDAAGCEKIRQEKQSGKTTRGRDELERALDELRAGDQLVVTRLDRLARSVPDLYGIVTRIDGAGAALVCLNQSGIDTGTPTGKLMLGILGVIAEFENDLRAERQAEGIKRAKEEGRYARRGRAPKVTPERVLAAIAEVGVDKAHKRLGISRSSVYRIQAEERARADGADAVLHAAPTTTERSTDNA